MYLSTWGSVGKTEISVVPSLRKPHQTSYVPREKSLEELGLQPLFRIKFLLEIRTHTHHKHKNLPKDPVLVPQPLLH